LLSAISIHAFPVVFVESSESVILPDSGNRKNAEITKSNVPASLKKQDVNHLFLIFVVTYPFPSIPPIAKAAHQDG
jgi:hypothetical protein